MKAHQRKAELEENSWKKDFRLIEESLSSFRKYNLQ